MEPLGIDTREWNTATMDVIKFARKVNAEWDENEGLFRPCEDYRRDEEWIIHWLKADKFLDLTSFDPTGLAYKFHIQSLKNVAAGAKILVVLEGLTALLARAKTARSRVHDAAVRAQLGGPVRSQKDERLENVNVEDVENVLIEMQLVHEFRVVQTSSEPDTAEWISILATDIATIPYRYSHF
jgi:crossover junction endonuclease EME1